MPIVRTYVCPDCNHMLEVTLSLDEWDTPPPACPACAVRTQQEFTPVAIVGSHRARAVKLAETIAAEDYGVANMQVGNREGDRNKVRYKDQWGNLAAGGWVNPQGMLESAVAAGRQVRQQHGSSLDIIKQMPDLIANSKKMSGRIW